MTRWSVALHPASGKSAASESSASGKKNVQELLTSLQMDLVFKRLVAEKAEDIKEQHGLFSHHLRSTSGNLGALGGFICTMDDRVLDYDSGYDYASTSSFEFQKGERASVKALVAPYLNKTAPSKWDDAEKWLVNQSPGEVPMKGRTKSGPLQTYHLHGNKGGHQERHVNTHSVKNGYETHIASTLPNMGCTVLQAVNGDGLHHQNMKKLATTMLADQSFELPSERTKKMDAVKSTGVAPNFAFLPVSASPPKKSSFSCYSPTDDPVDMKEVSITHEGSLEDAFMKPSMRTRKPTSDSFASVVPCVSPAPAVRSVSMRDMGTEMTPIASQEPSRTGTPIRATTPTLHSPVSSPPSTPRQGSPTATSPMRMSENTCVLETDGKQRKEMHIEMGREMHIVGAHAGGKLAMVSWTSKEEEDADASKLLKNIDLEEVKKNVLETRAVAWEEAEQSKCSARFKREEQKILAWENHEKAKAEAQMRRIEVKVEKTRSYAHETLMKKLAVARRKAENRLAAAEARRCEQANKSGHRADYIRRTGRLPSSSFFSCGLCR